MKNEMHTDLDLNMDWNEAFDFAADTCEEPAMSISDAMIRCLSSRGCVDIEYIAESAGVSCETTIEKLKGAIYQNPDTWNEISTGGFETAEEYLSGNLIRKWQSANEANRRYNGRFEDNLKAIERLLPTTVAAKDIYITLGSPWVPSDVIDEFIKETFGDAVPRYRFARGDYELSEEQREYLKNLNQRVQDDYAVKYDPITGTWEIPHKTRYRHSVAVSNTYGTPKLEALHILEKTLNMKSVSVTDEVRTNTTSTGKKRVINEAETLAALEKQKLLIRTFQEWVWKDTIRTARLKRIFEERFACVRRRCFDGSFLEFPTMSDAIKLFPHQKNAVARILFSPNTLLAHDVGAGKTYVMIAAGQELKRMGLSSKNVYVVPNNIVGQWVKIFLEMYPDAKLLCVEPKNFTPAKRKKMLERMRDEDFDGIIIAYSCFEQIRVSERYYRDELAEEKKCLEAQIKKPGKATGSLKSRLERISKKLGEMAVAEKEIYDGIYFDELGITRLFVDEAHNFKNVPIETKANNVLGVNAAGSKRCKEMMDKVHLVQKANGGKGVVMATGTPVTNSITEVYILQKYLQSGELAMLDLQSFDSWVGMFAERHTEFEIDVDTNSYRLATRFSEFHNLPELTAMLSMVADFHQMDESDGIPAMDGYKDSLIPRTEEFAGYLKTISARADAVRRGHIRRTEDNMLKITTDGRKAALDFRLVEDKAQYSLFSKVARCAGNVAEIYFRTSAQKSTQVVFCDTSTPKEGFNLYDELKERLMGLGIPGNEIAFVHDAATERKRSILFDNVRTGEIRVLLGSTFKLGLGVNIQDRLIALHHLDVPWRPADMTQREGRILRQGNRNPKVEIHRYITEGSFDAYSWQLLETKQRFITELLSGSLADRDGKDVDDTVLNYAEVKALAIGNPLVKERVEAQNELSRYRSLQKKSVDLRLRLEKELSELPEKIAEQRTLAENCRRDCAFYRTWKSEHPEESDRAFADTEQRKRFRERLNRTLKDYTFAEDECDFGEYKGFSIVLPAHMDGTKPYILLEHFGRYHINMADSETGNLIRLDNFLEAFPERQEHYEKALADLVQRQADIEAELSKHDNYADLIEKWQKRLLELDEKLGVKKDDQ